MILSRSIKAGQFIDLELLQLNGCFFKGIFPELIELLHPYLCASLVPYTPPTYLDKDAQYL